MYVFFRIKTGHISVSNNAHMTTYFWLHIKKEHSLVQVNAYCLVTHNILISPGT